MQLAPFEQFFSSNELPSGRIIYQSGMVTELEMEENDGSIFWVGKVKGSGRVTHEVEIELLPSGHIRTWDCSCPKGEGCKHLAAALYKLKEMSEHGRLPVVNARPALHSLEEALAAYEALPLTEQRLVKITAVLWEATSQTKLQDIFNRCGFRYNNFNLYPKDIKPMLLQLEKQGLLMFNGNNNYECPKPLADALCSRYFAEDPDFKKTVVPIQQFFPLYYGWYNEINEERLLRDMRIARYADNPSNFEQGFSRMLQAQYGTKPKYTQRSLTYYWLGESFDEARLESFAPRIRAFLLYQRITLDLFDLRPLDAGFYQYGLEKIGQMNQQDHHKIAALLAQVSVWKGDWAAVERLSPYFDKNSASRFVGIRLFIEGHNAQALEAFELAQKAWRNHTHNSRDLLDGIAGLFQILSRLKAQDAALHKLIRSQVKQINKKYNSYQQAYFYLQAVVEFLENNKPEAERLLKVKPSTELDKFFHFLCQFWVSERLVAASSLQSYRQQLSQHGFHWMAAEMNALLGELSKPTEGFPLPTEEPLFRALPRIEEWENALKMLLDLGGKTATATEVQNRIAWLVNFEKERVQARHQTFGKNGWTKGRLVSFERLRDGEVPGLMIQDLRFIGAISYAWSSELDLSGQPLVWKHLVGHPLLFLEKSPDTAVQLVESKPTLIAKRTGKGYQLQFSPQVFLAGATIVKETPTRYVYIEATEQVAMIARAFNGKALSVPERGEEQLREALSGLANLVQVQSAFEDENLPAVEADGRICVHLLSVGDGFHVELYVKPFRSAPPYVKPGDGEAYLIGLLNGQRTATTRNQKLEKENLKALREKVPTLNAKRPSGGTWQLDDAQACLQLLLELRPLLDAEDILLEWPKGEKFRISTVVGFDEFRMSIREGGSHWFEVEGELRVDEQQVLSLQDLLALSERQSAFVELSPGKFLALTEEFRRRLQGINGLLGPQKKGGKLVLHALAAPAAEEFFQGLQHFEASQKFLDSKARLEAAFAQEFKLPKRFQAELRPYQLAGFQWLHRCAAWGVGACLADDMGLGKTVQALAFLTDRAKLGPALVVAPASVCRNWVNETARFAPALNPILFSESDDRAATIKTAKKGELVIVTYDLMTREEALFTAKKWATVILDEAQAIKNRATKRSETAMQLQTDFRMVMTGTPIENHLGELWNLFNFLNPGLLGSIEQFAQRFSGPIERDGDENRREQLRRLVQPFVLRRRKDEVLKDLPEKTEITLSVELPPNERAFYEALRRNAIEKLAATADDAQAGQQHLRILAEIMKLRRAACHPTLADPQAGFTRGAKLELFEEVVDELLDNGHKALVFSQFVDHLKILERSLKAKGIRYQYLDGSTPGKKRQQAIDAFQAGEGDIFLISLKAGGTGLNLTAADFVIHTDPWWNPAVEDQATDRAHRIGQERPVTVYRLVAEQTIEEKIIQLHAQKRDLADSLLAGADVSAKLSANELMALLREGPERKGK